MEVKGQYQLLIFAKDNLNQPMLELNSQFPFASVKIGETIQVKDIRQEDARESLCKTSGRYAKVLDVHHRITQRDFEDVVNQTRVIIENTTNLMK